MYIMIPNKHGETLYAKIPDEPTLLIRQYDEKEWAACLQLGVSEEALVLAVGPKHEVHETVNKLLMKLNLAPEKL